MLGSDGRGADNDLGAIGAKQVNLLGAILSLMTKMHL